MHSNESISKKPPPVVHTDNVFRSFACFCDFGNGQGRSVCGDDAVVWSMLFDFFHDGVFHSHIFENGFNDHIGSIETGLGKRMVR